MSVTVRETVESEEVLWNQAQTSAVLGLSRTKLWAMDASGELTAVRIGRAVRWKKSAVLDYIRNLGR